VKITIDTKEDSPDEIRKIIHLLSNLANLNSTQKDLFGAGGHSSNLQDSQSAQVGFMKMFEDMPVSKEDKKDEDPWSDKNNPGLITY